MGRQFLALTNAADTRDRASAASGFLSGHSQYLVTGIITVLDFTASTTANLFNAQNQLDIRFDGSDNIEIKARNADGVSFPVSAGNTYRFVYRYNDVAGTVDLFVNSTSATDSGSTTGVAFTATPNWAIGATADVDYRWEELAFVTGRVATTGEISSIMAMTGDIYDDAIEDIINFSAEESISGNGTARYTWWDGDEDATEQTNNATSVGPDWDTLGWRGSPTWSESNPFEATDAFTVNLFHGVAENGGSYDLGSMPASESIRIPITLTNDAAGSATTVSASVTSGTGSITTSPDSTIAAGASSTAVLTIAVPSSGSVTSTVTITSDGNPDQTLTITGDARSDTVPTVNPHSDWDGTADSGFDGSGEATPTESASVYGSGFTRKAIAVMAETQDDGFFYTEAETHTVAVTADHGDIGWIERVEFFIEGVQQDVHLPTWDPRGFAAFRCTIDPTNATVTSGSGVVRVYARVVPVNGHERLLGPVDFFVNASGADTIFDETIELAASGGGDQTTLEGAVNATNPAAITLISITEAATYTQTSEFTDNEFNNGFPTIIRNDSGGVVKIYADNDDQTIRIRHDWLWLQGITFPFNADGGAGSKNFFGAGGDDGWHGYACCHFVDEDYGALGPRVEDGDVPYLDSRVNETFVESQGHGAYDCVFDNANGCISVDRAIGCDISHSYDGFYLDNDRAYLGNTVDAYEGQVRLHSEDSLEVSSASYNGGSGQTTITFTASGGWTNPTAGLIADEYYLYITSGTLAGQQFDIRDTSDGNDGVTPQIVVDGDASSLTSGDTCLGYIIPHGDGFQTIETSDYDNHVAGYNTIRQADGTQWMQWILAQCGDAGSWTNAALQMNRIVRDTVGGATGQLQDNATHVVFRGLTIEGVGTIENGIGTYADVFVLDSYFASEGTTPGNVTMWNCHTGDEDASAAQGVLGTGPEDADLANGVPGGSSPLRGKAFWNRLRYDINGNPITGTGSLSVGAIQSGAALVTATVSITPGDDKIIITFSEPVTYDTFPTSWFSADISDASVSDGIALTRLSSTVLQVQYLTGTFQIGDEVTGITIDGDAVTTVSGMQPIQDIGPLSATVGASSPTTSKQRVNTIYYYG